MPKISVLMAVFDCERYLPQAIESILNQTHSDFELVIVNDGSTDSTSDVLTRYAARDQRINVISNPSNIGLARSLNRGLEIAQGEFIARMDADDVSLPERLALQLEFMEQHPEIGVLGTNITYMDVDGRPMNGGRPKDSRLESPNMIKWALLWRCPIYHPTVMMRRSVLEQTGLNYDPQFEMAEDRELWVQLCKHTVIARLPEVALHYRVPPTSISRTRTREQRAMDHIITRRELTTLLGTVPSTEGLETLIGVFTKQDPNVDRDFGAASDLLFEIYHRFSEQSLSDTDREQIRADVADRLIEVAKDATRYSPNLARSLLWRLRHLLSMHLFSVETAMRILKVVLNSFGIRRRTRQVG